LGKVLLLRLEEQIAKMPNIENTKKSRSNGFFFA
jgi:hypothetical protein